MKQFVVVITLLGVVAGGLSFECHRVGLYADQRARDCDGYFVCSANEKVARRFTCPEGMRFSQRQMKCVSADAIFCNLQDVVSNFQCQTEGAQGEPDKSTGCWDTVVCLETRNGSLVGLYGLCQNCSCVLPDVEEDHQSESFDCPDSGRFADSTDCASYHLCVRSVGDSLVWSKVTCPATTLFSPSLKKCVSDTNFKCPNEPKTTNEPEPAPTTTLQVPDDTFNCPDVGRFPDAESMNCKDYFVCSKNADGAFVKSKATCPQRTVFNPDTGRCVLADSYVCPSAGTTSTTSRPPLNDCVDVGRFPDDSTNDCKKYFVCSKDVNGTLIQSSATCPPRTVFNPDTGKCVLADSYVCPSAVSTTTTSSPPLNDCVDVGRFPNESSSDCKRYFVCSKDVNGTLIQSSATCPPRTVFNPDTRRCVLETTYTCPKVPTPSTPSINEPNSLFVCQELGRFVDVESSDCKKYIMCTKNAAGQLISSSTTCPPRTVFNGETKRCVLETSYVCARLTTAPTTAAPVSCPDVGRYPDRNSLDCRAYILCTHNEEGELLPSTRRCPPNNVFTEVTRRCVPEANYSCNRV